MCGISVYFSQISMYLHSKTFWFVVLRWSKVSWCTRQIQDSPFRHLDEHRIRASRTDRTHQWIQGIDGATRVLQGSEKCENAHRFSMVQHGSAWFSIATATRFCGEPLLHSSWFLLETAAWSTGVVNALPGIHTS
jgi:hypothetical protein